MFLGVVDDVIKNKKRSLGSAMKIYVTEFTEREMEKERGRRRGREAEGEMERRERARGKREGMGTVERESMK